MVAQRKFRTSSFVADKAIKAPCVVVSDVNLVLSGEQTVNSVAVLAGDRVLVANQTDPIENGIYDAQASAWARAADWDGERDATEGTLVIVRGTPNALWQAVATGDISPGTDAATFDFFANATLAADLASTANGLGASLVAIEDSGGFYTAAQVEAALAEIFATPSATTRRLLELATQAEVDAGTDAVRAVTPATLRSMLNGVVTKVKLTDTTHSTDIIPTNDPDLVVAIPEIGTYAFELFVTFWGTTTGTQGINLNVNFSGTVGRGSRWQSEGRVNGGSAQGGDSPVSSTTTAIGFTASDITVTDFSDHLAIRGVLVADATGNFAMASSQQASEANNTNIGAGSYMVVTKLT